MADGITPSSLRSSGPNAPRPALPPRADLAPTPGSAADAYVPAPGDDLQALAALVKQIQERITALEARVSTLAGEEDFAPVPLGQLAAAGRAIWQDAAPIAPARPQAAPAPAPASLPAQPAPAAQADAPGTQAKPRPTAGSHAPKAPTYTVRPGDTLWTIAARELGDPLRFHDLIEANKDTHPGLAASPDFLAPGWTLTLPKGKAPPARPRPASARPADQAPKAGTKPRKDATAGAPTKPASKPDGDAPRAGNKPPASRRPQAVADHAPPRPEAGNRVPPPQQRPAPKVVDAEVLPPATDLPRSGPGKPTVPVAPPALGAVPGFDPSRGFVIERQETQVEAIETETDTRWEVGPDGQAKPTQQATEVTAAETVTRTRWRASGTVPAVPGPVTPTPVTPPTPTPGDKPVAGEPAAPKPDAARLERLRKELDVYLKENTGSGAVVALARDHKAYLEAATLQQKAKLVRQALGAVFTDKDDRKAALSVLRVAAAQGELLGVLNQLSEQKKLQGALRTMSGTDQGREMARLFLSEKLYANSGVVRALDSEGVSDLLLALGWKHPMIGTSDALRELPEGHKKAMIAKLLEGDFSLADHRQATWLNQHLDTPLTLPDYDPNRMGRG